MNVAINEYSVYIDRIKHSHSHLHLQSHSTSLLSCTLARFSHLTQTPATHAIKVSFENVLTF